MHIFFISALIVMSIQSAELDQSPQGYLNRLKQDPQCNYIKEGKFCSSQFFRRYGATELNRCTHDIKHLMRRYECEEYADYFIILGSCARLDDVEKCAEHRIMIPRLQQLQLYESQQLKDEALHKCLLLSDASYFVARLLLIGLYTAGANLNQIYGVCGQPLRKHLLHDDIPLIEYVLYKGADPNAGCLLSCCKSRKAALLLLVRGADFHVQHAQEDLIDSVCSQFGARKEAEVLEIFFDHVQLNTQNGFGKKWFTTLSQSAHWFKPDDLIARVGFLLKKQCYYDDQIKEDINKGLAKHLGNRPETLEVKQATLKRLFNRYEK